MYFSSTNRCKFKTVIFFKLARCKYGYYENNVLINNYTFRICIKLFAEVVLVVFHLVSANSLKKIVKYIIDELVP